MEETQRPRRGLAAVCCLFFAGALLPVPGDGQNLSSDTPSTASHIMLSLSPAGSPRPQTTLPTVGVDDDNTPVTSQVNDSSSSLSGLVDSATQDSLDNTSTPQNMDHNTKGSVDIPSLSLPTANLMEANESSLNDAEPKNTTLWIIFSTNGTATEPSWSKETQEPTTASQPESFTFRTLGLTERRLETMPVTDHEAITEESHSEATLAPNTTVSDKRQFTVDASSTTEFMPVGSSSTLVAYRAPPVETEQPANHVEEKTPVLDGGDYNEELPGVPAAANPAGEDPLVIAVIFISIVTIGILALMGFLKYRKHNNQLQFRRLQDLPMDDMMEEDTPLSLYSY